TAIVILQSGHFAMPGGALQADGTVMVVPELGGPDPVGDLTVRLTGPAAALAQLSDSDPLSVASRKGIVAADLSGEADLSLSARIPLDANADISGVHPEFRLMLQGLASESPIAGRAIAAADLVLQGHPEDYTIEGVAEIDGISAALEMRAVAGEEDSAVELALDRAARERLGLGLDGIVDGLVMATLQEPQGDGSRRVSLDLAAASLDLPFVGWEKGHGVPALAEFVFREEGALIAVSDFSLIGDGFHARGGFTLERESGRLRVLDLAEVSLRPGDSFAVSLTQNGDGYDLAVTGSSLDARIFIDELQTASPAGDGAAPPISLSIGVDRVTTLNGVVLRNVRGSASVAGGRLRQVTLAGRTEAGERFDWSIAEQGGRRRTLLRAADGGAILSGLGLYTRISGGELTLDIVGSAGSSQGRGLFTINRFQIVDEAALADALAPAVARVSNRREAVHQVQPTELDARNMQFSILQVPFERQGDLVTIQEAFLRGAMLGGTGSGVINLADRHIDVSGSLIPIFGINNIAGAIPLIGPILGGGRNEGLVGITYKLLGPVDSPTLHMNPLSAIAPGIFRRIFEYR
ncbi:MAG TPA: AsmA-like C-terminal domain-containing protein, partial [Afifellaceae bacterium]|nr:AsmA-like C-terminal domain-containing protein [Afifellaceae bacterium]